MVKRDEARKFLSNVPDDKVFWLNGGPTLKNLSDLEHALHTMSDDTYRHHVNKEKNDFSNWISAIIGDKNLAMDLVASRNKESATKKVKNRVHSLKKMAG